MTTRTERGVVWSVRDLGRGLEEWTRVAGEAEVFRAGGTCALVDATTPRRPAGAARSPSQSARRRETRGARIDRIVLSAAARQQVVEELAGWDAGLDESKETGGFLSGLLRGTELIIRAASGPGPAAVRGLGGLRFDPEQAERVLSACLPDETLVGTWHSHPRNTPPSRADMKFWACEARWFSEQRLTFSQPLHLGLIVKQKGRSWAYPRFEAYLSRGDSLRAENVDLLEERWRQ
jgi:hypothetical protein